MLLKNERGSVLILALIVLVVGAMVGVALLTVGVNEDIQVSAAEKKLQAYYVARAATDAIASFIVHDYEAAEAMDMFDNSNTVKTDPDLPITFAGGTATAEVYIITEGGEDRVVIETFSEYGTDFLGHAILILDNKEYFKEYAIWAENDIDGADMTVAMDPDGDFKVGSNGEIDNDPDKIDVVPPDEVELNDNAGETYDEPDFEQFSDGIDDPVWYDDGSGGHDYWDEDAVLIINDSIMFDDLTLINTPIEINTGADPIQIVAKTGGIKSGFTINGGGVVEFYIWDEYDIQTPAAVSHNAEQLTFFLYENADFSFQANGVFSGYIYGPSANVSIGSSATEFHGGIIAGTFDANGNPTIIYDEPSDDYDDQFPPGVQRGEWRD